MHHSVLLKRSAPKHFASHEAKLQNAEARRQFPQSANGLCGLFTVAALIALHSGEGEGGQMCVACSLLQPSSLCTAVKGEGPIGVATGGSGKCIHARP